MNKKKKKKRSTHIKSTKPHNTRNPFEGWNEKRLSKETGEKEWIVKVEGDDYTKKSIEKVVGKWEPEEEESTEFVDWDIYSLISFSFCSK